MLERLKRVFSKEYWFPYAEALLIITIWFSTESASQVLSDIGFPFPAYVLAAAGALVLVFCVVVAPLRDQKKDKSLHDERDIHQDLLIANDAYHVAIFGLGAYLLLWNPDPLVLLILLATLLTRLVRRFQLERE